MDRAYQVKQFVGKVQTPKGSTFFVFTTGDPKYLLFSQLDPSGNQTGLMFPVAKSDLRRDWRKYMVP